MDEKIYYKRLVDDTFDLSLRAFGATNIVGPKWCGKTKTAEQRAKSAIYLQKYPDKEALLATANINPSLLLKGANPRLIDEWQDAPTIWDAVRSYCDDANGRGLFILTGSTSKKVKTSHSGTGRICTLKMYPMSLYESFESNGQVSLMKLFNKEENLEEGCHSDLTIEKLIFAACRGGWPESILEKNEKVSLFIAKKYFQQIYTKDMFQVDDVLRNSETMKTILRSYARNISTLAKTKNILDDVNATNPISLTTLDDYIDVLEKLYIVEDLNAWSPAIRSKTAIRSGKKREFVDPSIAVAALGGSPEYYSTDLLSFGFIFETLCIRDLRVYSQAHDGSISYYHDRTGLEADAVLHLDDGRYALIEFKLGGKQIEEGAKHLLKLEDLIKKYNEESKQIKIRMPDLKIIITGTEYGYKRPDGVFVIPIGCLKD